jgi:hypothetical protein
MDNSQESRTRRSHKARERQQKRRERSEAVSSFASESLPKLPPVKLPSPLQSLWAMLLDNLWQMREEGKFKSLGKMGGVAVAVILLFVALSILFSPNIGPNIHSLGLNLGGKSIDEATTELFTFWNESVLIVCYWMGRLWRRCILVKSAFIWMPLGRCKPPNLLAYRGCPLVRK